MEKKIYELECICKYCERAKELNDESSLLCDKHGVVAAGYTCRRFSYDVLKRSPARAAEKPRLEYVDIEKATPDKR